MFRSASFLAIAALTVSAATAASQARQTYNDNFPYWYLGLNGQLSYVPDSDLDAPGTNAEVSFDPGYALGASIGYRPYERSGFLSGARFELEYTYRDNNFDNIDTRGASAGLEGDFISHNVMLNLFYDFDTDGSWTPYVGAGVGMAFNDFKSSVLNVDDTDEVLAYQGMAGLYYSPQSLPDTEWGFGYRYYSTLDSTISDRAGNRFDMEYDSHNLEFLTRFRF